jgi:hypothetical protein
MFGDLFLCLLLTGDCEWDLEYRPSFFFTGDLDFDFLCDFDLDLASLPESGDSLPELDTLRLDRFCRERLSLFCFLSLGESESESDRALCFPLGGESEPLDEYLLLLLDTLEE